MSKSLNFKLQTIHLQLPFSSRNDIVISIEIDYIRILLEKESDTKFCGDI